MYNSLIKEKLYHKAYRKRAYVIAKKKIYQKTIRYREYFAPAYRLKQYGLTATDFANMLILQAGRCDICHTELKKPQIDHSHLTGAVRGLLCIKCNWKLGVYEDIEFKQKAEIYLRSHFPWITNVTRKKLTLKVA